LGFWINPSDLSNSYELIINDLKEMGNKKSIIIHSI